MYCIGFHSHSASHTRLRPWCGGACLAWRPLICASSVAPSLLVQAVVHCGPLRYNADTFLFGGWSWNGLRIDLSHLPNVACSQFRHLLKTVLFRLAWVGSASQ